MQKSLDFLQISRDNALKIINRHSIDALNHIPTGFSNNLIWNFGHVIITQQLLCYKLSGLQPLVSNDLIVKYRKGSRPEALITEAELTELTELSNHCIEQTIKDNAAGKFAQYKTYTTSYGATLSNIDEAIVFNNIHEGLHLGTMMALRKFV